MITAEDIKLMAQSELKNLVEICEAELDQQHKVNIEKAWTEFFKAATNLLNLGEKIKVDWDDPYEDEGVTITELDQFCHYRER